eukprot:1798097-Rhodomonas_salina.1
MKPMTFETSEAKSTTFSHLGVLELYEGVVLALACVPAVPAQYNHAVPQTCDAVPPDSTANPPLPLLVSQSTQYEHDWARGLDLPAIKAPLTVRGARGLKETCLFIPGEPEPAHDAELREVLAHLLLEEAVRHAAQVHHAERWVDLYGMSERRRQRGLAVEGEMGVGEEKYAVQDTPSATEHAVLSMLVVQGVQYKTSMGQSPQYKSHAVQSMQYKTSKEGYLLSAWLAAPGRGGGESQRAGRRG